MMGLLSALGRAFGVTPHKKAMTKTEPINRKIVKRKLQEKKAEAERLQEPLLVLIMRRQKKEE